MSVVTGRPASRIDSFQNPQPPVEARPPEGIQAGPIRLVEGSLENQLQRQASGHLLQPFGDRQRHGLVLDHTRAGNQQQRLSLAASVGSDRGRIVRHLVNSSRSPRI